MSTHPFAALPAATDDSSTVLQDTVRWLERAVIGLNLCPFAKGVHAKGQIHYAISRAIDPDDLLQELAQELRDLSDAAPEVRDTTLLVAPACLPEFWDFNGFLARAERLLVQLGLEGELQIASFHPQFQFAGTDAVDVTNCSNRAPYPTLHLLREASIDRAVEAFPEAQTIFERNMEVLEELGHAGWQALDVGAHRAPDAACSPTWPATAKKTV